MKIQQNQKKAEGAKTTKPKKKAKGNVNGAEQAVESKPGCREGGQAG